MKITHVKLCQKKEHDVITTHFPSQGRQNSLQEKTSMIITTNKAPTEWLKTLNDEVLTSALLDHLLYLRRHGRNREGPVNKTRQLLNNNQNNESGKLEEKNIRMHADLTLRKYAEIIFAYYTGFSGLRFATVLRCSPHQAPPIPRALPHPGLGLRR